VALLVETSKAYGRGLLRGIGQYVVEHGPWSLYFEPRDVFTLPPRWLRGWRGDGIIGRLSTPAIARAVLRTRLPVVNLSSALPQLDVPRLEADTDALARVALEHLLERGFRRFAFVGDEVGYPAWSRRVAASFATRVERAGHRCDVFRSPGSTARPPRWEVEQAALGRWIARLPRPVAVFAINDLRGQRVLDACRRVGAAVPDEVAVLGNENDELVCGLATPPLSSVVSSPEKIGYEAARLLDRLMAGGRRGRLVLSFPPLVVATRQSTDVQAHTDPVVARAVRFIRESACTGIGVPAVVAHVAVSRATLDRRFRQTLGHSPHDEIVRVQLQRAMELLSQTGLKTLAVAEKSGFRHLEYMGVVFRKKLGLTPGEYRKRVTGQSIGFATIPPVP
jgi:LacI family transcriptional regulator